MYLLDANHCIHLINGNSSLEAKFTKDLEFYVCAVVKGELIFGANNSGRPRENVLAVKNFLSALSAPVLDVDEGTSEIYGDLKANLVAKFGPRDKSKRRKFKLHKELGISDNDLWIACVAIKNNLILLTGDETDFSKIAAVSKLRKENWLTKIH